MEWFLFLPHPIDPNMLGQSAVKGIKINGYPSLVYIAQGGNIRMNLDVDEMSGWNSVCKVRVNNLSAVLKRLGSVPIYYRYLTSTQVEELHHEEA